MAEVIGHCDADFSEVKQLLQGFLDTGEERGASIVVNFRGKNVIDIWGGCADGEERWQQDTIAGVLSCTKTVSALAALILIDKGLISVEASVSDYWPQFAANGKKDIKVRHILSHTSGISGWDDQMSLKDICDTSNAAAKLAEQAAWWQPGSASGYHSFTMGHLIGELVRRVTSKSLGQFILEEITKPLGADFQLGVAEKDRHRVASIVPPAKSGQMPEEGTIAFKTATNPVFKPHMVNESLWKNSELGAANGFGNARSLVQIMSTITLGGKVNGTRLLSPETIDLIFKEQSNGVDLATGIILRFGIGYGLTGPGVFVDWLPEGRVCFWGGYGGSMVVMDLDRELTIGYVMNKMEDVGLGSVRTKTYINAVYAALAARSV